MQEGVVLGVEVLTPEMGGVSLFRLERPPKVNAKRTRKQLQSHSAGATPQVNAKRARKTAPEPFSTEQRDAPLCYMFGKPTSAHSNNEAKEATAYSGLTRHLHTLERRPCSKVFLLIPGMVGSALSRRRHPP